MLRGFLRIHAAQGKWRPKFPKFFIFLVHNSIYLWLLEFRYGSHFISQTKLCSGCFFYENSTLLHSKFHIWWRLTAFPGSCILWGAAADASADISVDTSVDTRSSVGRYSIEYRPIYRSSIDRCIDRFSYRSIYLVAHRDFTDTSPILHRYCTDASPLLYLHRVYWLISVDISVDTLVDTRPTLDRSINALVSFDVPADTLVDTSVDSIKYHTIYRSMVSIYMI